MRLKQIYRYGWYTDHTASLVNSGRHEHVTALECSSSSSSTNGDHIGACAVLQAMT